MSKINFIKEEITILLIFYRYIKLNKIFKKLEILFLKGNI